MFFIYKKSHILSRIYVHNSVKWTQVGSSHRTNGVDYALESIHNVREALPELWEASGKSSEVTYPEKAAIETYVRA